MKKNTINYGNPNKWILFSLTLILIATINCKKGHVNKHEQVRLSGTATLGAFLVDNDGRTLYYFANDSVATSTCKGNCALLWPAFHADKLNPSRIGEGLDLADFGEITTEAGTMQTTYKGRPLYYYAPPVNGKNTPEAAGETKGEAFGGVWFVAKPDYTIMLTRAQLVGHDGKNYTFTIGAPTPTYAVGNGKSVYFTDAHGVALYIFRPDKANTNTFTKSDFSNNAVWPIYEQEKIVVPSILDKTQFSVINVFGKKQLTYKGWPLYYFGQDAMAMGATKGVSFPAPGVWPVATKDLVAAPAP